MASNDGTVRIGDAERDQALDALGGHMRAGRLDPDEYSERAEQVAGARYAHDLTPVFEDLPGGRPTPTVSLAKGGSPLTGPTDSTRHHPRSGFERALLMLSNPVFATVVYMIIGFAFGGWAWGWIVYLAAPLWWSGAIRDGADQHGWGHSRCGQSGGQAKPSN